MIVAEETVAEEFAAEEFAAVSVEGVALWFVSPGSLPALVASAI